MLQILRCAAVLAAVAVLAAPVAAEHRKIVDGLEINLGIVPVPQLMRVDAYERSMHREAPANATHHVVVGVADAKGGTPVPNARVTLELVDPRGGRQIRQLSPGDAGGVPDYSGLFRFGWSGAYTLRVVVARADAAPVKASFRWVEDEY